MASKSKIRNANRATRYTNLGYHQQPTLVHKRMMFAAEFDAIDRISVRMLFTHRGRHPGSVNASAIRHDLAALADSLEHCRVEELPKTIFVCSWSRRQQAMSPPQPSSCSKYSLSITVFSTNRIPVRVARSLRLGSLLFSDLRWVGRWSFCKRPNDFREKCLGHGISTSGTQTSSWLPNYGRVLPLSTQPV
jgi:hypothetical protein